MEAVSEVKTSSTRPVVRILIAVLIALLAGAIWLYGWVLPARDRANAARATQEGMGLSLLRHSFSPAQALALEHRLADADRDGVAEHLPLDELIRADLVVTTATRLPSGELGHGAYRCAMYLPDGAGGATTAALATPSAIDARERHYVAYAWPVPGTAARRAFAIDERGVLHICIPAEGAAAPPWNALYGGGTWGADPAPPWEPHRR